MNTSISSNSSVTTPSSSGNLAVRGRHSSVLANNNSPSPSTQRRRQTVVSPGANRRKPSITSVLSKKQEGKTKKDLTEQEKLNNDLAQKNQELEQLNKQYESLQAKLSKLIVEKNGYVNEIGTVRNLRRDEVAKMKEKLADAQEKMQETRVKLARVEQIENGILKLYLEMRERGTEVVAQISNEDEKDENVVIGNDIEDLKKEDPLVLLDRLKINLRTLLAFKDDYENELKDQLRRRKSEAELKLEQLKKRMMQLEKETLLYKSNAEKAISIKDDALAKKEVIFNESEKTIAALEADRREMLEMKRNKEKDIAKLRSMLDRRDEILRHREIQMMKITQLQTQIEKNKLLHKLELNNLQRDNNTVVKDKEKQLAFYNKVRAEKKELQQRLQTLTTKLNSFKHDANRSKYIELNEREQKLTKKVAELKETLKAAKDELELKEGEVENLLAEHDHLMKQFEEQNKKIRENRVKLQQSADLKIKEIISKHYTENMERNPQLADYYKKKVKEREKDIVELTKQVRKMILVDHSDSVAQKNYEMEIFRMVSEIEKLKRQNVPPNAQDTTKPEAQLRKRNQELEKVLSDYESIEREARTQAVAYEKLQTQIDHLNTSQTDEDYDLHNYRMSTRRSSQPSTPRTK